MPDELTAADAARMIASEEMGYKDGLAFARAVIRLEAERDEARAMLTEVSRLAGARSPGWSTVLADVDTWIRQQDDDGHAATATIERLQAAMVDIGRALDGLDPLSPRPSVIALRVREVAGKVDRLRALLRTLQSGR